MYDLTLFNTLVGRTRLLTDVATDPTGSDWITTFTDAEAYAWPTFTYDMSPTVPGGSVDQVIAWLSYYGRADAYAAFYKMGGYTNTNYYDRMVAHATYYFNWYNTAGNVSPFNQMIHTVALYYALTGDPQALVRLGETGEWNNHILAVLGANVMYGAFPTYSLNTSETPNFYQGDIATAIDPRTKARPLESLVLCALCNAPSTGSSGFSIVPNWTTAATAAAAQIIASADPTGSWREPLGPAWANWNTPGFTTGQGTLATPMLTPTYPVKAFESGMVHDALMFFYDNISADSAVVTAIETSMSYMETGGSYTGNTGPVWDTVTKGWKYLEFASGRDQYGALDGFSLGSPELNGMIVQGAAFLYRTTGNAAWKTRAEEALSNVTTWSDVPGYATTQGVYQKLLNQGFARSYKAWPDLYGTSGSTSRTLRLRGV